MKHKRSIPKDRFRVGRRLAEKTIRKFARGQKYFPFMSQVDGGGGNEAEIDSEAVFCPTVRAGPRSSSEKPLGVIAVFGCRWVDCRLTHPKDPGSRSFVYGVVFVGFFFWSVTS